MLRSSVYLIFKSTWVRVLFGEMKVFFPLVILNLSICMINCLFRGAHKRTNGSGKYKQSKLNADAKVKFPQITKTHVKSSKLVYHGLSVMVTEGLWKLMKPEWAVETNET